MTKNNRLNISITACFLAACLFMFLILPLQAEPGAVPSHLAIKAGQIVTVSGKTIRNGIVLVKDGKIEYVGAVRPVPDGYMLYEYPEGVVYPGFINAKTIAGLHDSGFIKQSTDTGELGMFLPHVCAATAFYSWGKPPLVARDYGVLTALVSPVGYLIGGKASLVDFDGWNPADMVTRAETALIMALPRVPREENFDMEKDKKRFAARKKIYKDSLKKLETFLSDAYAYYKRDKKGLYNDFDQRFDAMKAVWEKKLPIILTVNYKKNILEAIRIGKKHKLNLVLAGMYEAADAVKEIKAANVPVILDNMASGTGSWDDGYNYSYRTPAVLYRAGILFAFSDNYMLVPSEFIFQAGIAVAHGLPREEAVKALCLNPAKILGLSSYGSIEPGKIANLFVASGDIFDTSTTIDAIFVKGKKVTSKSFFQKEFERTRKEKYGER